MSRHHRHKTRPVHAKKAEVHVSDEDGDEREGAQVVGQAHQSHPTVTECSPCFGADEQIRTAHDEPSCQQRQTRVINLLPGIVFTECRILARATEEVGSDESEVPQVARIEPHGPAVTAPGCHDDMQREAEDEESGEYFVEQEPGTWTERPWCKERNAAQRQTEEEQRVAPVVQASTDFISQDACAGMNLPCRRG